MGPYRIIYFEPEPSYQSVRCPLVLLMYFFKIGILSAGSVYF